MRASTRSLGARLISMMLISLLAALLIMSTGVLLHKYHSDYAALHRQTLTLAQVIASRSTGALEFYDRQTAHENLSALSASRDIQYAALVSLDGELFSEYQRQAEEDAYSDPLLNALLGDAIALTLPITLEGQVIGEIRLKASLHHLKQQLSTYLFSLLLITLLAFLSAFFLFQRLQKQVSEPVAELIDAAASVAEHEDYSTRVHSTADGDIAVLIDGFNEMLRQIQIREQKLADYQVNLKAEIARQSEALSQVHQQRMLWLETMADFLQHELKNATIGVNSSLDLMGRRSAKGHSVDVYLQRARKSMRYMCELLNSASAASSLEAAIHQEDLTPLDLSKLIAERSDEYTNLYTKERFTVCCDPNLLINGNTTRICQLLDKLVSNAIDHRQPGSVIEISLSLYQESHACIRVTNEGPVLPSDTTHLFELFFSARLDKAPNHDNLGLGLYVVRLITECHRGRVFALNREAGTGAVFNVVLPLLPGSLPVQPPSEI